MLLNSLKAPSYDSFQVEDYPVNVRLSPLHDVKRNSNPIMDTKIFSFLFPITSNEK